MPANASFEQRVQWHTEHSLHCHCRPSPADILDAIRQRGHANQERATGETETSIQTLQLYSCARATPLGTVKVRVQDDKH